MGTIRHFMLTECSVPNLCPRAWLKSVWQWTAQKPPLCEGRSRAPAVRDIARRKPNEARSKSTERAFATMLNCAVAQRLKGCTVEVYRTGMELYVWYNPSTTHVVPLPLHRGGIGCSVHGGAWASGEKRQRKRPALRSGGDDVWII